MLLCHHHSIGELSWKANTTSVHHWTKPPWRVHFYVRSRLKWGLAPLTISWPPPFSQMCMSILGPERTGLFCVCRKLSWLPSTFLSMSSPLASLMATNIDAGVSWKRAGESLEEVAMNHSPKSKCCCGACRKKAWVDYMLLFMWLCFTAALHEGSCILCNHGDEALPALGRGLRGVQDGSNYQWCHTGSLLAQWQKHQPTHEFLLFVWSVRMLVIIYFDIF